MPNVPRLFRVSALSVTILRAFTTAHADEGMWTFDNFPSAAVKARYGFGPASPSSRLPVKVRWIAN
jgi:hypothetical protein